MQNEETKKLLRAPCLTCAGMGKRVIRIETMEEAACDYCGGSGMVFLDENCPVIEPPGGYTNPYHPTGRPKAVSP